MELRVLLIVAAVLVLPIGAKATETAGNAVRANAAWNESCRDLERLLRRREHTPNTIAANYVASVTAARG